MPTAELLSEMPGSVIAVDKAVGDAVGADDTVLVIEAMKMEIPIAASRAGIIAAIHVAPGDQVEEGQCLAVIEL